ncbi:MAG: group II truncated hemoglobin [Betaproteobacteria bacterium]|nr:group II truncated hemoglobin [Betaproteobacteria bacterium]NCP81362.1 group II truncated hemoglobin [Rhodoferax sp.]OIP17589.1 MAG: globin [Comamonadaceae bacterium CG2_30_57_122]PIZ23329.1 MAG: globin [Comamonadaceae bacterium CG_4_10_14_0_8_um_filter_57_29]PJC21433.1 MAG: globin [Comamonadaceae bacterium CG_4_9_14_0_8_um_filter_57_21]
MNIEASTKTLTPFEQIGGEVQVRALTTRFYDLMDLEPGYAQLRAVHASTLDEARQKLFWFLCGWLGGPQHYVERFGHPRLRQRHMPYQIGVVERDQWLACMRQALDELAVPEPLRTNLKHSFAQTADWMRNQGDA